MSLLALLTAKSAAVDPLAPLPVYPEQALPYTLPTEAPYQVPITMITPTYDGSGSSVHPSVVDMVAEGFEGGFRGWRYWMGITPYNKSSLGLENPSILVSNEGFHWHVPDGLTNPLDDPRTSPDKGGGYNSDPELVWDPDKKRFVLYWRRASEMLHAAESTDGIHWKRTFGILGSYTAGTTSDYVSPAIIRDGPGKWRMWVGEKGQGTWSTGQTMWTAPDAMGPWTFAGRRSTTSGNQYYWHYDMLWDEETKMYFTISSVSGSNGIIHVGVSADGLTWKTGASIITEKGSYRPTMVRRPEDPDWYDVWYSIQGPNEHGVSNWWTKRTQVPRSEWLKLL